MEVTKATEEHKEEQKIATRIKELRQQLGIKQKEFVEGLSISAATLSAYEKRTVNPSITAIIEIAKKFDVSVDWLLGLKDVDRNKEDEIRTYSDILNLVVKLTFASSDYPISLCKIKVLSPASDFSPAVYALEFSCSRLGNGVSILNYDDGIREAFQTTIGNLLSQYSKVLDLYLAGTIDDNIFNAVTEKLQKDFDMDIIENICEVADLPFF